MLLYLMRHGEAVSQLENTQRPLSKRGEADVADLAGLLAQRFKLMPGHIFHSPKARAAQTASIISQALPRAPAPEETDGLTPSDDPAIWAEHLEVMEKDTMLVGHLPHLPLLASLLLLFDSGKDIIDFTPGTILCLEKSGKWRVKWMISPDILKNP
jgi:phosphohistidine phosphatase